MWAIIGDIVLFDPATFAGSIDGNTEPKRKIEPPATIRRDTTDIELVLEHAAKSV